MAVQIGTPGGSAKEVAFQDFLLAPALLATVLLGGLLTIIAFSMRFDGATALIVVIVTFAAVVAGFRKDILSVGRDMARALRFAKGADGEDRTAAVLARLPEDYVVIHDFHPMKSDGSSASWNVDHIVLGPNGVFLIDTKYYRSQRVPSAAKSTFTKKNVGQTQRNAVELKKCLKAWSAGALGDVFVVPLVVYVQDGAFVENTHEGPVKVIPLKWLEGDILRNSARRRLDPDEVYRLARTLFSQLAPHLQGEYRAELDRFGRTSRTFKMERAAARSSSAPASRTSSGVSQPTTPAGTPSACPLCGGSLVKREAKRGARAGKLFLGCENYASTRCGFVFNLDS